MSEGGGALRSLVDFRAEIEIIDAAVIDLLAKRMRLAREVGSVKRAEGLPLVDPAREAAVVARASALARDAGLAEEEVRALYWRVMAMARRVQAE
jgi:chorismate mutase